MADKKELDFTYSTIDKIFRLSMGETGDFSGARYNGDFSKTLEQAQRAKHEYIAEALKIGKGTRVLDLGCGWGPFLNYAQNELGAECVGVTLSEAQAHACCKNGFDVKIMDCRCLPVQELGKFDAIVSIGAFEHFCSPEEYINGNQVNIYRNFFRDVHTLLNDNGMFYLQTMVFGKNMLPLEKLNIEAEKNSDEYILALMAKQFPGSWLPYGKEMVLNAADEYFTLSDISSGRLDYIETIRQWRKNFRKFNFRKYYLYLSLLPNYFKDKEFKHRVAVFKINPNKVCFERELMDHYRIVFRKRNLV